MPGHGRAAPPPTMPRPICTNRDMKPIRRHLAEAFGPGLVVEKAANHLNNVVGEIVVRLRTRKGAAA